MHICPKCQKRFGFVDQLKGSDICSDCAIVQNSNTDAEPLHRSGITAGQHAVAALPLILVFVGGALGGVCGVVAYTLSVRVFKMEIPTAKRYIYSFLISAAAVIAYVFVVVLLVVLFPSVFGKN